ncbi:hypothetical protein EJ04DRAFT_445767 [Polyplosphaeria fusca]|uniref:Elongin-A n=1 Tax=Polyplosphaeria fusca TaxID=682080 RepID=A0A9P4UZF0_9PLEO|nr:hypothetical protein EJ04DRAFT_445767 [Polyplosphaeria fusca]
MPRDQIGAASLYDISKRRLIANIQHLTDVGDIAYFHLAPILKHIQNPDQLALLEQHSPQLLGETADIWLRFIQRDIPDYETKPHNPKDPTKWSKVYKKLKREAEQEQKEQEEELRARMDALQKNRAGNQTRIVNAPTGYDPSARRRGPSFGGWGPSSGAPAKTGRAALDKLKRGIFDQNRARPKASRMTAEELQRRRGTVQQAPQRMLRIEEANAAAAAARPIVAPRAASVKTAGGGAAGHQPTIRKQHRPPQRTPMQPGERYTAPKLESRPTGAAGVRRRREEHNPLMAPKRARRV